MCGRYALYGPHSRLQREFDFEFEEIDKVKIDLYNIAPSQWAPVIRATPAGRRSLIRARWGLLPSWVKEPGKLTQPINAKVETAAEKPMFRHAFRHSRVLVPISGFYEWQPVAGGKQPFFIRPVNHESHFALGGLLERWDGPDGVVLTFAVLTTEANELIRPIHDRMPVIIRPENYDAWLDPELVDAAAVRSLASPYPADLMEKYPVGRAVGNPRAQGPELIEPTG
ncbi:MAG: SOS response-associated peptidase [Azoarcus sp.]|nr:SOS response-associated peptidase [Azoarcus sp.]